MKYQDNKHSASLPYIKKLNVSLKMVGTLCYDGCDYQIFVFLYIGFGILIISVLLYTT